MGSACLGRFVSIGLHAALPDRMLDAKQFGASRLHSEVSGGCFP
jgi:hypothetical protein